MDQEYKAWRYHADHAPRLLTGIAAIEAAEAEGWKDSPAKCEGFLDKIGVDPTDKMQVQYVGEVTEQTVEVTNLLENVDTLDKQGLLRLVELQFNEKWASKKLGAEKLRAKVKQRIDADTVIEA